MSETTGDIRIFVSYRRADTSKAAILIWAELARHFGGKQNVFQDVASIMPGIPWDEAIEEAVGSCHVFLVVIGDEWLTATDGDDGRRIDNPQDRHRREIEVALGRRIPVLPVLIDEAPMPAEEHLPGELKRLHKIQAQRLRMLAFDARIEDLIDVIRQAATMPRLSPAPLPPTEPPVEEPEEDTDGRKREEAIEKTEQREFMGALEIAASIEDPVARADVFFSIAKAQAEAGTLQSETHETLVHVREATIGIADSAERDRVLAEVESVESEIAEWLPPEDQRRELAERGTFGAPEEITGESGSVHGDNSSAAKEPGEPDHAGNAGGRSVWYRWTVPITGTATIDTVGSDFDTLLAVYRGSSLAELDLVAANDDADGTQSRVTLRATEGDEYRIAVDGYAGVGGAIVLNWHVQAPQANTYFDSAEEITGSSGTVQGNSTGASKEPSEPDHAGNPGGSSVWYRWTAPEDGVAVIDTFRSEFDTLLAVYRGSSLSSLDFVAANDDNRGRQSRVTFRVEAGDEYMIAVDGYAGSAGAVVLNWVIEERQSLLVCLDQAGLRYQEVGGGAVKIPFGGTSADRVVVDATESEDGAALFSADLPAFSGFGRRGFLQILMKISYGADYVKALSLPNDQFAIAAEIPASALTPSVVEGLVRSLANLGDVKSADLRNQVAWSARLDECKATQDRHIRLDPEQARRDTYALLDAAGLSSIVPGRFDLDLGPEIRPLTLHVSPRVISMMVTLEGVRPGGDSGRLSRLLELNREADVAKIGLDANGDVTLLYEVPQAVPDLAERAIAQLRILYSGVRAAI